MTEDTPKRRRGRPKTENERFQLVIDKELLRKARTLADRERRTVSNMLAVLVEEALKDRGENRTPTHHAPIA